HYIMPPPLIYTLFPYTTLFRSPQYIKAFLFNSNTEIEVPIKNTYTTFFEIQLNLKSIPEFKSDGINKIKIIYKKDDLFTEQILIEPRAKKSNTTLYKKIYPYNYKVDYTFGWGLFIKKQKIETIFDKINIENNKLIIETKKIDPNSMFKLKNYKESTIIGYKSNNQVIFDLNELSHSDSFFELNVFTNGLVSFNYTFRKKQIHLNLLI